MSSSCLRFYMELWFTGWDWACTSETWLRSRILSKTWCLILSYASSCTKITTHSRYSSKVLMHRFRTRRLFSKLQQGYAKRAHFERRKGKGQFHDLQYQLLGQLSSFWQMEKRTYLTPSHGHWTYSISQCYCLWLHYLILLILICMWSTYLYHFNRQA